MILYRMAKMMEERELLSASITGVEDDAGELLSQRAELQERMLAQANEWAAVHNDVQEFI